MRIVPKLSPSLRGLRCRLGWHSPAFDRSWGHDIGPERTRCLICGTPMERTMSGGWKVMRATAGGEPAAARPGLVGRIKGLARRLFRRR